MRVYAGWLLFAAAPVFAQSQPAFVRMADGKRWLARNLDVPAAAGSYCYDDAPPNCRKYGRLYTWEAAQQACRSLGEGWRLPSQDDWRDMAAHYGGWGGESTDGGKSAFRALMGGGAAASGFRALRGGGRTASGEYARAGRHGFFWTSTETGAAHASFYNFGLGLKILNRHSDGEKQRAFSVRCVSDR